MAERNCDGSGRPVVAGGMRFDRCPVAWAADHPAETALWETYVDCCGGVLTDGQGGVRPVQFLPMAGSLSDQPHLWLSAFRVFAGEVQRLVFETAARNGPGR